MLKLTKHYKSPRLTKKESIYTVCCWSGVRRVNDNRYKKNKLFYIDEHLNNLHKYKHNLNHIVFAISENPSESFSYKEFINKIPKKIQNATVEIFRRPNIGMSYGMLSDVYQKYKQNFKYYFTIEDDYTFTQDHFDQIFINKLNENSTYAYVCACAGAVYADISVGCIRSEALEKVAKMNENVLYPLPKNGTINHKNYDSVYKYGQFNFGVWLRKVGYTIVDMRDKYHTAFRDPPGTIRWFFKDKNPEPIILPI